MPLSRQQKEERVSQVQAELASAVSVVFVAYDRLTVAEVNELRASLHAAGGNMRVVPKRLLHRSLSALQWEFDPTAQPGQLAAVWGDDPVAPAKALSEFKKIHPDKIQLLAGVLEGSGLSLSQVSALAALPTRDELRGMFVGVISGPARAFVSVLAAVPRSFVYALQAIADQKKPA